METIVLDKEIHVMYVTATSFPAGVMDAHNKLRTMVPSSPGRRYFGISRPENNGGIVYRAGAEELAPNEGASYNCETLVLKKGKYYCITIHDFMKHLASVGAAFREIIARPEIDPEGYCVEWYLNDNETVKCMVRLNA